MRELCRGLLLGALSASVAGCDYFFPKYAAEVGIAEGGSTRWEIWGDFDSLDACRSAAIGRYNQYFSQGRAQSWACLQKNGSGGYASRHR
jgi:hypothetical protein